MMLPSQLIHQPSGLLHHEGTQIPLSTIIVVDCVECHELKFIASL